MRHLHMNSDQNRIKFDVPALYFCLISEIFCVFICFIISGNYDSARLGFFL